MRIMKLIGSPLYQWESGRQLEITQIVGMRVDVVHFSHCGDSESLTVKPRTENGKIVADIPNIILQSASNIVAYCVSISDSCVETIHECVFHVRERPRPSDYVYTETELHTITSAVEKALAEAKESGDFDGADGKDGTSVTHEWEGTVLKVTSASGTTSADLKGEKGDKGDSVKGDTGDPGYTPVKGVDYFDGKDGSDGVSCTHSWDGTTLTVTSASGSSSADLKGGKGDPGYTPIKGVDYFDGQDGKDGYTPQKGIDYFDGADGKDGHTPVKGVDYFDGDKGEPGYSGVYVGSDTPPDNANVWVVPNGEPSNTETWTFTLEDGTTVAKSVVVVG